MSVASSALASMPWTGQVPDCLTSASSWMLRGPKHGCCWETFYIFAHCGLVGNPHLTAKLIIFAPLPTSTKQSWYGHKEKSARVGFAAKRIQNRVPSSTFPGFLGLVRRIGAEQNSGKTCRRQAAGSRQGQSLAHLQILSMRLSWHFADEHGTQTTPIKPTLFIYCYFYIAVLENGTSFFWEPPFLEFHVLTCRGF